MVAHQPTDEITASDSAGGVTDPHLARAEPNQATHLRASGRNDGAGAAVLDPPSVAVDGPHQAANLAHAGDRPARGAVAHRAQRDVPHQRANVVVARHLRANQVDARHRRAAQLAEQPDVVVAAARPVDEQVADRVVVALKGGHERLRPAVAQRLPAVAAVVVIVVGVDHRSAAGVAARVRVEVQVRVQLVARAVVVVGIGGGDGAAHARCGVGEGQRIVVGVGRIRGAVAVQVPADGVQLVQVYDLDQPVVVVVVVHHRRRRLQGRVLAARAEVPDVGVPGGVDARGAGGRLQLDGGLGRAV